MMLLHKFLDMTVDLDSNFNEPQASEEPHQFRFWFNKPNIFHDVSRVILSKLGQKSLYSVDNRDKVRLFLQIFIPQCFQVELQDIETRKQLDDEDDNRLIDTDNTTHSSWNEDNDISDLNNLPFQKGSLSPNKDSKLDFISVLTKNQAIGKGKPSLRTFFCGTSFYCFLRQYEVRNRTHNISLQILNFALVYL